MHTLKSADLGHEICENTLILSIKDANILDRCFGLHSKLICRGLTENKSVLSSNPP
jgi:hypothetical protein